MYSQYPPKTKSVPVRISVEVYWNTVQEGLASLTLIGHNYWFYSAPFLENKVEHWRHQRFCQGSATWFITVCLEVLPKRSIGCSLVPRATWAPAAATGNVCSCAVLTMRVVSLSCHHVSDNVKVNVTKFVALYVCVSNVPPNSDL